jgi:hypothetical protein
MTTTEFLRASSCVPPRAQEPASTNAQATYIQYTLNTPRYNVCRASMASVRCKPMCNPDMSGLRCLVILSTAVSQNVNTRGNSVRPNTSPTSSKSSLGSSLIPTTKPSGPYGACTPSPCTPVALLSNRNIPLLMISTWCSCVIVTRCSHRSHAMS